MFTSIRLAPVTAHTLFNDNRNNMGVYQQQPIDQEHDTTHTTMYPLSALHQLYNDVLDNPSVPETDSDQTYPLSFLFDMHYQLWFSQNNTAWPHKKCIITGHIECSQEQDRIYITQINHQSIDFSPYLDDLKWVLAALISNEGRYNFAFKRYLMVNSYDESYKLSLIDIRTWVNNTFETELLELFQDQPTQITEYTAKKNGTSVPHTQQSKQSTPFGITR